ncbi:MAG: lasso peptide biosynthesis B2 protein [Nitrospirae bacterium]|nr:lasso peptide biosynthesis B2 protein [Nitrospirota bacterium]
MRTIKKIRSNVNSLEDVGLFLQIFFLITILPLLVKFMTVPQLMKTLTPKNLKDNSKCDLNEMRDKIEKYTLYILSKDFWMYKNICLKRSLVIYHFLRKYGMYVTICFGVRYINERPGNAEIKKMEGHAWLVYNGDIFLEKNVEETKTYRMTYCYPKNEDEANEKELIDIERLM